MLGISITFSSKKEILEHVQKYLSQNPKSKIQNPKNQKKSFVIVTPNPEQVMVAHSDSRFREILNQADIKLPDGIGIVWASRFFALTHRRTDTLTLRRTIPGVELMEDLVGLAAKKGYRVALIGGRDEVAVKSLECLQQKHPGLVGWAEEPGEIGVRGSSQIPTPEEDAVERIAKRIVESGTRIVFVGLGAPKQEYFIKALSHYLSFPRKRESSILKLDPRVKPEDDRKSVVLMSVGGAFDMISGRTPRAPHAVQAMHLEWLWRLVRQPWRVKRQLALVKFAWLVVKAALQGSTW